MNEENPVPLEHPELANVPVEQRSDIETARLIGRVLSLAAARIGYSLRQNTSLDTLADAIIQAARKGAVDPFEYRLAWWLRFGGPIGG